MKHVGACASILPIQRQVEGKVEFMYPVLGCNKGCSSWTAEWIPEWIKFELESMILINNSTNAIHTRLIPKRAGTLVRIRSDARILFRKGNSLSDISRVTVDFPSSVKSRRYFHFASAITLTVLRRNRWILRYPFSSMATPKESSYFLFVYTVNRCGTN